MCIVKNLIASSAAFLCLTFAAHANSSVLVQAPIDKVFVPQGFDDNDKVEVIVHGHFTSSCYKMGPVAATIDSARKKVVISAEAYYYPGAVCLQMVVPFIKSVELKGQVPAGNYSIEVANRPEAETTMLSITRATRPDADDYLYAAVHSATLEQGTNGEQDLVLKGQHPYLLQGCIKFDQVKTYLSPSKVLVVQPITRIEMENEQCIGHVNNRFEHRIKLNPDLDRGEYVMHVRVLDGNSVNQFLSID